MPRIVRTHPARDDLLQITLRRFTVGSYVFYYEPIQSGIRLVRVLHGARKIEDLLS